MLNIVIGMKKKSKVRRKDKYGVLAKHAKNATEKA